MNTLVVYSSITGNTRKVAEAIARNLSGDVALYPVGEAPAPQGYDLVLPGFWVNKAMPDLQTIQYLKQITGQCVAYFGTLAAWPDSPHAMQVIANTDAMLDGNTILGSFLCQGRLAPKRMARYMDPAYASSNHPMTPERKARLLEAEKHPDQDDLDRAAAYFLEIHTALALQRSTP